MTDFLLTQIINYGLPILGLFIMLGAVGVPIPTTLIVLAVGAFCRQGLLSLPLATLVVFVFVVIGDSLSYGMGYYFARTQILHRFQTSKRWLQAEQSFQRWGGFSVFISRFLLTGIAIPVNLIAGTGHFPYNRFLMYDMLGEVIWTLGYGGLGYWFGSNWELVGDFLRNFGGLVVGISVLVIGLVLAIRRLNARNNFSKKTS